METIQQAGNNPYTVFHFKRSRLNQLFMEAMKYPLIMVCAGAGYGKTSAVHDFVQEYQATTIWVQLSQRDNVEGRFWENYTYSISKVNKSFAEIIHKLGFPDNAEKLNQYSTLVRKNVDVKRRIMVLDDFHLIENPAVIRFVEECFRSMPAGTTPFLISRSTPRINIAAYVSNDRIFNVNEDELRFTESELARYFRGQGISLTPDSLRGIMQDTGGWVFAINLIAHSYKKAPGYEGYLRNAMKSNIFRFMETEIWDGISERLQNFLVRLSLIDHLSVDMIALLAGGDEELIFEMERQNAYVRRDDYINAYLIHHLFLEFLRGKQELLPEEQKRETYAIAGDWCNKNGFKIDALAYYEKTGDYEMVVSIFFELPTQIPQDIARYAMGIFDKIPQEAYDKVDFLAVMHVRTVMCLGLWQEACRLAEFYEAKYLRMPEDNPLRNHTLGGIYYCWGILRSLMCTVDDIYDFDGYYAKFDECLSKSPIDPGQQANYPAGPWISMVGAARKGAPQEYIEAITRAAHHVSHCFNGAMTGIDDLVRGELMFYQDDVRGAEPFIIRAMEQARERKQYEIVHRALFYTLRIAVLQGNYTKVQQALREMEVQLNENEYTLRFVTYDIALAWYYCLLCELEKIPDWLKDKFTPYGHASFIENFGNQIKALYCYLTNNYPPLLAYIEDQKKREAILFGRIEMLAMEACVHYKMKNREKACYALEEAYKIASPNDILMPFIELGKDMRTLTSFALKKTDGGIPKSWLESINRKSASYAKRLAHVVAKYKQASGAADNIAITRRESEILTDLSHGLSRTEIAAGRGLSINTVKMIINNVYMKLGAENLADAIRIAAEKKIV
jgi:LuxR family maltose regulon positive regulatory protein